jgi:hypothetical protein
VEEFATINVHFPAAELPIRSQQKVKFEQSVLRIVQGSPAHQAKIGDVLLVLQTPDGSAQAAGIRL